MAAVIGCYTAFTAQLLRSDCSVGVLSHALSEDLLQQIFELSAKSLIE